MARRFSCLLGVALLFPVPYAGSVEVLSARELVSHCIAFPDAVDTADGQYCIRYIQGFIDGAVATDARVLINLEAEYERKETFSERATRVRAPNREMYERAAGYAEYCLGDPVSLRDVVGKVVNDLNTRKHLEAEVTARDVVYASLRKHYPCKEPNPKK